MAQIFGCSSVVCALISCVLLLCLFCCRSAVALTGCVCSCCVCFCVLNPQCKQNAMEDDRHDEEDALRAETIELQALVADQRADYHQELAGLYEKEVDFCKGMIKDFETAAEDAKQNQSFSSSCEEMCTANVGWVENKELHQELESATYEYRHSAWLWGNELSRTEPEVKALRELEEKARQWQAIHEHDQAAAEHAANLLRSRK